MDRMKRTMHLDRICLSLPARGRPSGVIALVALAGAITLMQPGDLRAQAAEGPGAAAVQAVGEGKSLECRALQLIVRYLQLITRVFFRFTPEAKAAVMSIL